MRTRILLASLVASSIVLTIQAAETINVGTAYRTGTVSDAFPEFLKTGTTDATTRAWNLFGSDQTLNGVSVSGTGSDSFGANGLTIFDSPNTYTGSLTFTGDPQQAAKENIAEKGRWNGGSWRVDITALAGESYNVEVMSNPISGTGQRSLDVTVDGTLFADNLYVPVGPEWSVVYKFPVTADADGIDITFGKGADHDGSPWVTGIAVTGALPPPPPPPPPLTYDFDGPDEQGWVDVKTSAVANANTDFDAVDSSWGRSPQQGDGWLAPVTSGASGWNQRDGQNDPFVIRSPSFVLDTGDISFFLQGGVAGGNAPANFSDLGGTQFLGLALRDDATDDYVLSAGRPSNGDGYQEVTFTAAELVSHVGGTFTLDYIDDKKGGWGWGGIDSITVPMRTMVVIPEPSTFGLTILGLLAIALYYRLRTSAKSNVRPS